MHRQRTLRTPRRVLHPLVGNPHEEKNKGCATRRLDHFLLSPKMSDRLADGSVDRWARGEVNASDHTVWIRLDL